MSGTPRAGTRNVLSYDVQDLFGEGSLAAAPDATLQKRRTAVYVFAGLSVAAFVAAVIAGMAREGTDYLTKVTWSWNHTPSEYLAGASLAFTLVAFCLAIVSRKKAEAQSGAELEEVVPSPQAERVDSPVRPRVTQKQGKKKNETKKQKAVEDVAVASFPKPPVTVVTQPQGPVQPRVQATPAKAAPTPAPEPQEMDADRGGLLAAIRAAGIKKLKKTVTVDKSGAPGAGTVLGAKAGRTKNAQPTQKIPGQKAEQSKDFIAQIQARGRKIAGN